MLKIWLSSFCIVMISFLVFQIQDRTPIAFSVIAGMSTMIGGFIAIAAKAPRAAYFAWMNGLAAGVMIIISIFDMMVHSSEEIGVERTLISMFVGVAIYLILGDFLSEEAHEQQQQNNGTTWFKTFLVVTAHNFPEGLAVAFATVDSTSRGILMMLAICLHNIPEGLVIAATTYAASNNRRKALLYTFLSSIAEPIGAILSVSVFQSCLSKAFVDLILAAVAGIMLMVSFVDLFPSGLRWDSQQFKRGLVIGGSMMGLSIYMLHA